MPLSAVETQKYHCVSSFRYSENSMLRLTCSPYSEERMHMSLFSTDTATDRVKIIGIIQKFLKLFFQNYFYEIQLINGNNMSRKTTGKSKTKKFFVRHKLYLLVG